MTDEGEGKPPKAASDDLLRDRVPVKLHGSRTVLLPITVGAYEPRGSGLTQQRLRAVFLELVASYESRVLEDLSGKPLTLFRAAGWGNDVFKLALVRRGVLEPDRTAEEGLPKFRKELSEWGDRWGLNEDWCLLAAFDTLEDWVSRPEDKPRRFWSASIHTVGCEVVEPLPGQDRFTFEYHNWDVLWTEREDFEDEIRRAFEDKLKLYLEQVESEAESRGYEVVQGLRGKRKPLAPIEWLVRYRVQRRSIHQINDHYFPKSDNRNVIRKGINEAATLLGFPPYEFAQGGNSK